MNRFEALRDLLDRDSRNDLDALNEIMSLFPNCTSWKEVARELHRSLKENEKLQKIEQSEPPLDKYATELAIAVESGQDAGQVLQSVKKLNANQLKKLGDKLGFELEGNVTAMRSAVQRWVETGGTDRPLSASEKIAGIEEQARDILQEGIDASNAQRLQDVIKQAHDSLSAPQFKSFAERLNLPTGKGKKQTLNAIKSFIDNQSVLAVQTAG